MDFKKRTNPFLECVLRISMDSVRMWKYEYIIYEFM